MTYLAYLYCALHGYTFAKNKKIPTHSFFLLGGNLKD